MVLFSGKWYHFSLDCNNSRIYVVTSRINTNRVEKMLMLLKNNKKKLKYPILKKVRRREKHNLYGIYRKQKEGLDIKAHVTIFSGSRACFWWKSLMQLYSFEKIFVNLTVSLECLYSYIIIQFSSVTQLCPTLCHPMDCSMPSLPVHHQLPELAQTHIHWVSDAIQPSHPLLPLLLLPSIFPSMRVFSMSWLFASGGQSIGVSASASVLPMSIQGWFPLGLTGLISLLSKGLSRVFSSTTIWKHQFFSA